MAQNAQYISNLPVGAKVRIGKFNWRGDEDPIVWTVASKDHWTKDSNYPTNAVTLVTDKIIGFMAYDAKEPDNANMDRARYGNARYRLSNIRQWLNTDKGGNEWYVAQNIPGQYHYNDRDTPPSEEYLDSYFRNYPYDNVQGFLGMFRDYERQLFLNTKVKTAINPDYDYSPTYGEGKGSYDINDDQIFILSISELGLGSNKYNDGTLDSIDEGVTLDFFSGGNRTVKATLNAYYNSTYSSLEAQIDGYTSESNYPYMTRSAVLNQTSGTYDINDDGSYYASSSVTTAQGLRPATNITNQALVSLEPDSNGVYDIVADVAPIVEVLDVNVLTLDYIVRDMKGLASEVNIYLNGNLEQTVTTNLDSVLHFNIPYSGLINGENEVIFVSKDTEGLQRTQLFKVNANVGLLEVNDKVSTSHEVYNINDAVDNLDGTLTLSIEKNLKDTIPLNETVEKIEYNYFPSVFVSDDYFAQPVYQDMEFKQLDYSTNKSYVTEEWELPVDGAYCSTKILLKRNDPYEDVSLRKISQIFGFKHEL
ncbi:DUF6273 domain-containing protein [Metabacillus litoralis]|uniref:DUF6273 domain-containing protein n=1 Tax=Metabacillus litoralis TaxID=152268 RepID=UPI00203CB9B7|nr:DUF6273 domain-containing protein [Metabacillus litoralis]MCM3160980.1 DUF6273 domain-containing protein [Metabacillus litoralis]